MVLGSRVILQGLDCIVKPSDTIKYLVVGGQPSINMAKLFFLLYGVLCGIHLKCLPESKRFNFSRKDRLT